MQLSGSHCFLAVTILLSKRFCVILVQGSKRPRSAVTAVQDGYKSDFGSLEVNDSAITGIPTEQVGSHWDWDDDDRGVGTDIQALLSEFGDFGDFFVNDALPFGEVGGNTLFSFPLKYDEGQVFFILGFVLRLR